MGSGQDNGNNSQGGRRSRRAGPKPVGRVVGHT